MYSSILNTKDFRSKFTLLFFLLFSERLSAENISGKLQFPKDYPEKNGAVIWIEGEGSQFTAKKKMHSTINQVKMQFVPFLTVVTVGSTLSFHNDDPNLHMVKSQAGPLKDLRTPMIPTMGAVKFPVDKTGVSELLCDIHSQMRAYVVVVPNEYYAVSDKQGKFKISKVPPPPFTVQVWHEVLPPLTIRVEAQKDLAQLSKILLKTWQ